jgi:hypothetical protein
MCRNGILKMMKTDHLVTMKYTIEIPLISRFLLTVSDPPRIPPEGVIQLFKNRMIDAPSQFFSTAKFLPVEECMMRNGLALATENDDFAIVDGNHKPIYRSRNYSAYIEL